MAVTSRSWADAQLGLSEWLQLAVAAMGFERMTPVQASTIPLLLGHKDVVVEAVTGSGKTLSFLIPAVEKLLRLEEPLRRHHVGVIVLSPTRELAAQTYRVLCDLLAFHPPSAAFAEDAPSHDEAEDEDDGDRARIGKYESHLRVTPQLVVGGDVTVLEDRKTFQARSPNLLVGTPGRLLELLSSSHVHCPQSSFQTLILDEADRMLDIGFKHDLQKILSLLPKQRRTGLFSASVSEAVGELMRVGMRNPVKVSVRVKGASGKEDQKTPSSLKIKYIISKPSHMFPIMSKMLSHLRPHPYRTIVFLSTCKAVDYFQTVLPCILPQIDGQSVHLVTLHGKHSARTRNKHFAHFCESVKPCILLTTDIAARGLDIPQVDLVVQIDPPSDPKVFLHRCGRAGRAGRRGLSVLFLRPGREEDYVSFLQVRNTPATPLSEPYATVSDEEADAATARMRASVLHDRAIHGKAQRAFPAWVRSYSKHEASSIFRIADVDWQDTANAWALLCLPRMPEAKDWRGDPKLGLGVDFDTFRYLDAKKETQRQLELPGKDTPPHLNIQNRAKRSGPNSWSKGVEARVEKDRKRKARQGKRERRDLAQMNETQRQEHTETQRLVEEVKRRRTAADSADEFGGFED